MAEYPGFGMRMANYGPTVRTPEEAAGHWKEYTKTERRLNKRHLANKGDGSKVFPGVPPLPQEKLDNPGSFFGDPKEDGQDEPSSNNHYDRMFHADMDYNGKLHRDDRQHTVGLDIQHEEFQRAVPVRSSSEYGRRVYLPLEDANREHVRIDKVKKGFSRTRGTGIPTELDREHNCPS